MNDIVERLRMNRPATPTKDRLEAADEIERLRNKLADYDSQWSQIATFLEGDARNCEGHPKTMAGFVVQEIERLQTRNEELESILTREIDISIEVDDERARMREALTTIWKGNLESQYDCAKLAGKVLGND